MLSCLIRSKLCNFGKDKLGLVRWWAQCPSSQAVTANNVIWSLLKSGWPKENHMTRVQGTGWLGKMDRGPLLTNQCTFLSLEQRAESRIDPDSFQANSVTVRSLFHWAGWVADVSWDEMEGTKGKAPFKRTGLFQRNAASEGDYCVHYQCNDPLCTSKKNKWNVAISFFSCFKYWNCFSFWGAGDQT